VSPYVSLLLALVLGWAVPTLLMRMLAPTLQEGATVTNYRGKKVFLGLGVVWLVWAGCAIIGGVAGSMLPGNAPESVLLLLTLAGPLALVAFSLGMVDDALGNRAARGFKGHLAALRRGRLTTGGLKLLGISLASLFVALILSDVSPWGGHTGNGSVFKNAGAALLAGAAIALTSNFVNLTDLRPGRALKVSSLLMGLGVVSAGLLLTASPAGSAAGLEAGVPSRAIGAIVLALYVLGPMAAIYRYDLGEMGMLGDAGANPMGAVAGLLVVSGLPRWGLLLYLAVMFFLNVASERVSFTTVIEASRFLHRIDLLGRSGEQVSPTLRGADTHGEDNPE
jgi:UDP-GlcNAc:undecaprenyl-phosphate/decaprenyl-phosphate GlcNAc-1-phosphate transferase